MQFYSRLLLVAVLATSTPAVAAPPREQRPPEKTAPASTSRLASLVKQADLVVVGTLGKLKPSQAEFDQMVVLGDIAVAEVLKGPAKLKSVTLRTIDPSQAQSAPGGVVIYREGTTSIWLLMQDGETGQYLAINPSVLPPNANLAAVRRVLGLKETSPSNPDLPVDDAVQPQGVRGEPSQSDSRAKTDVDPKTASLAAALEDWIQLLEDEDLKTANARWAKDEAAADEIAENWTGLGECHEQHDYRKWMKNNSGDGSRQLSPGGAEMIGNKTGFRVGGHLFGHLHVLWKKTPQGWRIATVLQCL